jgi:uncharacterized membrane protein YphA (DoxX/SURF4 family)
MSCVQMFVNELHSLEWVGILLARVAVGLLFFLSGRAKLFVPERREQMRQTLIEAHIPFPDFNTFFVSIVEFVCGLLLVIGALTLLACTLLGCVMIMAITMTAIRNQGFMCPGLARGVLVSSRGALSGDSHLAILLRAQMAQR